MVASGYTGVRVPRRKWEHDGEDMPSAPRRPDGDYDWAKIKHQHWFSHDGPYTPDGIGKYPIGVSGLHCNRDCGERREGPVCTAWGSGVGIGTNRCIRPGKVVDEKCPWASPTDRRCPPSVEHEGITGWWYCGVHDPGRARERNRVWRIESDRNDALRDHRYDEDGAAELVVAEVIDWERMESEVGESICDTECEHHTCKLVRVSRAYVALIAQGDRLREEETA